jgi:hypothetical protein
LPLPPQAVLAISKTASKHVTTVALTVQRMYSSRTRRARFTPPGQRFGQRSKMNLCSLQ